VGFRDMITMEEIVNYWALKNRNLSHRMTMIFNKIY